MAGWHAEDIVVDYFEGEEWVALDDAEAEPELEVEVDEPAHESAA